MPLAIMDPDAEVLQHPACENSLRHCSNIDCCKRETNGVKLRKCGGCSKVVYCNLECQRSEWPRHKWVFIIPCARTFLMSTLTRPTCIGATAEDSATVARYGYASVSAFARDLQDFLDAHTWAFRMLTTVQRQLQLDANPGVPFSEHPRMLQFRLRCQMTRSDSHKHRNPATRFKLISHTFSDMDTYARKNGLWWEQAAALRDAAQSRALTKYPQDACDFFAVEYKVPGTHAGAIDYFPVHAPRTPAPGTPEQRRPILEDMAEFCTRSINQGFPMRMQVYTGCTSILAYPGTFVRSEGCWSWKAILEDWKGYAPGQHRALDCAIAELKTRMTIPRLTMSTLRITSGVSVLVSEDALEP